MYTTYKFLEIFNDFYSSLIVSFILALPFFSFQLYYYFKTRKGIELYNSFFQKDGSYSLFQKLIHEEYIPQLSKIEGAHPDLNEIIEEIDRYIIKTKGTTDFSIIQNKVERKLNMRYEQAISQLSFPTYIGLMGTFAGVFIGILLFLFGFDGANNVSDISLRNLLSGVLVSIGTSFVGLLLTTINTSTESAAKKNVEKGKNYFYDFIQTELMPSLDVSMIFAIMKLHETIDKFEPSFNNIIDRFQSTFDRCTREFGQDFESNVKVVAQAVNMMGCNMDKINENVLQQENILKTLKSREFVRGMDKYIEAANHFMDITRSLNKFEEARRLMLASAQETINIQNAYSDSLKLPKQIAVRLNQILERIIDFEENLKETGKALTRRDILGNEIIESIQTQIQGISEKGKIADKFLGMADDRLSDLYHQQIKVLETMNHRYQEALLGHIKGFENMLTTQTEELEKRHIQFIEVLEDKFNAESVKEEFSYLHKLEDIEKRISELLRNTVNPETFTKERMGLQKEILSLRRDMKEGMENIKQNMKDHQPQSYYRFFSRKN